MSPVIYVQKSVRNCTVHLSANHSGKFRLPEKAENPCKLGYDPELDTTPELDPDTAFCYLTIIHIQRWMINLRRIDIITKVSLLSSNVALPWERQLDVAVHVMAHVGQRYNSRLVYDCLYPEINHSVFKKCNWSEFYRDAKDAIPMNSPEP